MGVVQIGQKHGKLLAPNPCDHAALARGSFYPFGNGHQGFVTGFMAPFIVHGLEPVRVQVRRPGAAVPAVGSQKDPAPAV